MKVIRNVPKYVESGVIESRILRDVTAGKQPSWLGRAQVMRVFSETEERTAQLGKLVKVAE